MLLVGGCYGLLEDAKCGFTVVAFLYKIWVIVKILVSTMFENQPAVGFQQLVFKNQVWQCWQGGQCIRRVGEDEVVLGFGGGDKFKHIGFQADDGHVQPLCCLFHKLDTAFIQLNKGNVGASARSKFVADTTGSAKQVECVYFAPLKGVVQDIEEGFFGQVGGRSGGDIFWWMKLEAFVTSAYYSHGLWG